MAKNIDQYAVIGNPVAHSKSPFIHTQFALQTRQKMQYDRLLVKTGHLPEALDKFSKEGGKGASITLPFKIDAFVYADYCTDRANRAGAVNTIKFDDNGDCFGDNVDGLGLVRDITVNLDWSIHKKRVLILGAGGAVRGVLEPLAEQEPEELVIANRTVRKAVDLRNEFSDLERVSASGFEELSGHFDLIINGTAASLLGEVPAVPPQILQPATHCYDMAYGHGPTAFMQWAQSHGCEKCSDGMGMLVEQAAEQFYIWRGVRPETAPVLRMVRTEKC